MPVQDTKSAVQVTECCNGMGDTCMGMMPSQENWKLAQLWMRTIQRSNRHSAKKIITITLSRSCNSKLA